MHKVWNQIVTALSLAGILGVYILVVSCGGGGSGGNGGGGTVIDSTADNDLRKLFKNIAENVIVSEISSFVATVEALNASVLSWKNAALADADTATALSEAQVSFESAILKWQQLELMQVGPAGVSSSFTGGKGLRDEIYSWPTTNFCLIDQELANNNFEQADYFKNKFVNVYGLDALDYLLFDADLANDCSPQLSINTSGTWAAIDESEWVKRKATYATLICEKLLKDAKQLESEWSSTSGNFVGNFSNAGLSGSSYASADKASNELFKSMFYLELKSKDDKVALPFGIGKYATLAADNKNLESRVNKLNKKAIIANLKGFQKLFEGSGSGVVADSFASLLKSKNNEALALEMSKLIVDVISSFEGVSGDFGDHLNDDAFLASYELFAELTRKLKTDFVVALSLELPKEGAGDND